MPPPKPTLPPVAAPSIAPFDPWNSSSTGHQRAETRGPLGWRDSRNAKVNAQFRAGPSGGPRIQDTVGPGAADYDPALGGLVSREVRAPATSSVADMLRNPGTMLPPTAVSKEEEGLTAEEKRMVARKKEDEAAEGRKHERKIFDGLVVYVNGSTYPLVGDLLLKQMLAENGARTSLHLGRRQVTHVILGRPGTVGAGAGGGLAAGKMEREIRRVGGCGVKYVGVEWVLESIKAGKRLPEARFSNLKIAPSRQRSVLSVFSRAENVKTEGSAQETSWVFSAK
ncbi:hypothetical protein QBC34DRAFT_474033 [Podospora aff. communis PSN243]|uniref:BRCT domain-containing protein n=1 Tax=Podospora aff. communis PSN243 TaxID=3040156 RepID=A0AAV9GBV4_9PEZI|nr:hypothetical protein QBC34DRAFT_474033 [Podospora aff. communis PSN243]